MRERLVGFVQALRDAGLAPSVAESIDAVGAIAAVGVERSVLREALAATLVKDHADRPVFDMAFERYFAVRGRQRGKGEKPQPAEEAGGEGRGGGEGKGTEKADGKRQGEEERQREERGERPQAARSAERLARERAVRDLPFRDMDPRQVDEARILVETLARRFRSRWSRRQRRAARGRLDMRRTIRRAMSRGGVPVELLLRRPRPGKSDLLALVDVSYSTETAATFLLALLEPARSFFRRRTFLAYVDAVVEMSFEHGRVVPHQPIDLNARSDFGRVLQQVVDRYESVIGRNTVVLVLGDARNNRRPPRVDLLARLQHLARAVIWLNPDLPERWNTGDSVVDQYRRALDELLPAHNLRALEAGLDRMMRG